MRAAIATTLVAFGLGCMAGGSYLRNDTLKKFGIGGGVVAMVFMVTDVCYMSRERNRK
jgi:uncharacterized spore protein YtfJ